MGGAVVGGVVVGAVVVVGGAVVAGAVVGGAVVGGAVLGGAVVGGAVVDGGAGSGMVDAAATVVVVVDSDAVGAVGLGDSSAVSAFGPHAVNRSALAIVTAAKGVRCRENMLSTVGAGREQPTRSV